MSFSTIIDRYRSQSYNKAQQGRQFEKLIKRFVKTEGTFRGEGVQEVWLWSDFPAKNQFGTGVDVGIDLVLHTEYGEYWAAQCKCYAPDVKIDKKDVDTFLSTSGKSFLDPLDPDVTVRFTRRYLFYTSELGFTVNAEESLKNQNPPVIRYDYFALDQAEVDWDKLDGGSEGEKAQKTRFSPLDHQQKAIDSCHSYFKEHDRGKLIMACGTGKTYTSLKIAEKESEDSNNATILVLTPSIALVGQTLSAWCAQAEKPIHGVCICSDPRVSVAGKKDSDDDRIQSSVIDLALPASTSVEEIMKQLAIARDGQKKDGGMVVIFSTYQSIDVVSQTQKELCDLLFDLIICDEAHRTTGVKYKDTDESAFTRVHDNDFIKAKRRLYMTATPRLYGDSAKKKAAEKEVTIWSMDDERIYGEEIYRIGFGEAVEKQLLSDYKVLILTLNEDEMSTALQSSIARITPSGMEIPTDDQIKLIGCINALSKITKDEVLIKASDPGVMHNAIAFCQTIKKSKNLVKAMEICRDAYEETLDNEERRKIVSIEADHIDGTMGSTERGKKLSWLKNVDRNTNKCNVLMNVRCLSEGVDVPSLDAILFLSARSSEIDVVQSVGRVMRKAAGKKYGYIIVPVVIPSDVDPKEALDDNERFATVWKVLQALRAHDERFNATVQKIKLNKRKPDNILIGGTVSFNSDEQALCGDAESAFTGKLGDQLTLNFGEIQNAVYAKIVEKCGERTYWESWAKDVAAIAERHIQSIEKMIHEEGSRAEKAFDKYLKGLRKNINPSVSEQDAVEMLAQHFITQPVFDALFSDYPFTQNNTVSKSLAGIVKILNEQTPKEDNDRLEKFYASIRERAANIDNAEGRQKLIIELYDKFFKTAFSKTVEKLGIVYTPVEVVDFINQSVEDVLQKEFKRSISDEGVHVLDPFTGTGTFMVRLLQSGIIKSEDLERKYKKELHACEIVLLAYYIASINIENTYHDLNYTKNVEGELTMTDKGHPAGLYSSSDEMPLVAESGKDLSYTPFNGIVMTDTFQLGEDDHPLFDEVFPQNSKRATDLKKTPITVIIGNPPYSVGQGSANDNAQNEHYPRLEDEIEKMYAATSIATNKKSLYDSYIKAFRWSADKIGKEDGVIGFVTNAGYLDGNAMDGMRKSFEREFASIYIFNIRGNCRTSGELRRKEGGNVFGLGSRAPIAITILVKKKGFKGKAQIHYVAVDDYLKREEKLELCKNYKSVLGATFRKNERILEPNEHGDWITERDEKFYDFIPLGDKKGKGKNTFFVDKYSNGLVTARDAWCYNYSSPKLNENIKTTINFFNSESVRIASLPEGERSRSSLIMDSKRITWARKLINDVLKSKSYTFCELGVIEGLYRPFCKLNVYYDKQINECVSQLPSLFPTPETENLVICASGMSGTKKHTVLITDKLPDLHLNGDSQCFPLYWYEDEEDSQTPDLFEDEGKSVRHDGVTDFILGQAVSRYGSKVTKEDIFYYVYGILHSRSYAERFKDDLRKQLPRLPLVSNASDFWNFSFAGRKLATLHLDYENVESYADVIVTGDSGDNYHVEKMRFKSKDDKSVIIYNNDITVSNIPLKAYEYVVNGRSAIEWIMEFYRIKTDSASGIVNDPNDWAAEHKKPRYILDLLLSVINVSVQSVDIIENLPVVNWDKE